MKIYYAHPMSWYDTAREKLDLDCIEYNTPMGAEIVNPNADVHKDAASAIRDREKHNADAGGAIMDYFLGVVRSCDCIAYRTFDDGSIGAGVAKELLEAALQGKQIFRLRDNRYGSPAVVMTEAMHGLGASFGPRLLTIVQTRDYIKRGIM